MKNFFTFVTGLVIGSVVTYVIVKDKFEKIAQEEIDSVKEVFGRRVEKEADKKVEKIAKKEVEKIRKEYNKYDNLTKNYTSYSKNETEENNDEEDEEVCENDEYEVFCENNEDIVELDEIERASDYDRPYIIEPQEFGALDGYSLITLYHYSDNVLADDCDELVEDLDDVVGEDYASHFGEYEDDCVYVRNDRLKADYEICRDLRKYSDVVWRSPRGSI